MLIGMGLMTVLASGAVVGGQALASDSDTATTTTTTKTTKKKKHVKTDGSDPAAVANPDADNTGINKRDRKDGAATADQQKNDKTDLALTAEIRRSVMADKELSTNAHNVKIIAENGKVTLKGPVATVDEQRTIEKKARQAAGKENVTSMLEVKP
jgi:predicted dinucleotide-utilizing enzyme